MQEQIAEVLTLGQLAKYLQTPESTLYKLVQSGRLPAKKVGRQWRFHRNAIDRWLDEDSSTTTMVRRVRRTADRARTTTASRGN